jgi:hypothetical protein
MTLSFTQRNLIVSLLVLAFFAGMLVWSEQIVEARGREFPVLVSVAGIVLCLLDVIAHTDTAIGRVIAMVLSGTAHLASEGPKHAVKLELVAMLWIVVATALMVLLGFLAGIPAYVFGYSLLHARRTVWQSAISAIAVTIAIWIGFELLLSYDLYSGILFSA